MVSYLDCENRLKYYRDIKNSLDTAKEEGRVEGKLEIAKEMIRDDEPIEKIIRYTGLTISDINRLKE